MTTLLQPALLTAGEVAARLGVHKNTVYDLITSRKLNAVKIGKLTRIPADQLERFIAELPAARP